MRRVKRPSRCTDVVEGGSLARDQRGAATTEGVIIAMFLIACFALSLFLFKRYAIAMRTTSATRQALWGRVVAGSDDGDLDTSLAGAYPRYEARMRGLVPVLEPYHDTPRVSWQREQRDDRFITSPYLGAREIRYETILGTVSNETPDAVEEDLRRASVDTWCRVSGVCDPSDVSGLVAGDDP